MKRSFFTRIFRFFGIFFSILKPVFLIAVWIVLFVGLAWWLSQKPSLYRDWEPQDAVLPVITFSGNTVHIEHIRDHLWISDTEFEPRYFSGTYNLDELEGLDYIITPFSNVV